jgi:hypothetical protein
MNASGHLDDSAQLLAGLDISPARSSVWDRLLTLADEFAACPHAADDVRWQPPLERPDGSITFAYPIYSERVDEAYGVLAQVGAVSRTYQWMRQPMPALPHEGAPLSVADAIRLATATSRSERFNDGTIGTAVADGTLQTVLAALAAWYRDQPR